MGTLPELQLSNPFGVCSIYIIMHFHRVLYGMNSKGLYETFLGVCMGTCEHVSWSVSCRAKTYCSACIQIFLFSSGSSFIVLCAASSFRPLVQMLLETDAYNKTPQQ